MPCMGSSQGEQQGPCHRLHLGPHKHPSPLHSGHPLDRAFYPSAGNGSPAEESMSCLTPSNAGYPLIFPYGISTLLVQAAAPASLPARAVSLQFPFGCPPWELIVLDNSIQQQSHMRVHGYTWLNQPWKAGTEGTDLANHLCSP